ncbi:right-handed parallel beta-helix repeat-containing protein [uncultured Aquimarina sp.]|uniref:right-handed parallel beta-helix repeat-containing protein n=1 Tax=uncultured Aquimarina sp. TaxID=575652 RepID=UPI0026341F8B|nr:right-handed parallel beta-helix repeat-containing protein [uncultured Aquimarina sp.]
MKKLPYYLLFVIAFSYISCSNEGFEEIVADVEEEVEEEEDTNEEEEEDTDITSDNPCDFDLSGIAANSTIIIDCLLDLEGATVNLPANVNFDFEGGDIFNGTLVFSGGYIDGRLLNSDLTTEGDVVLKDPTFIFTPSRWKNIIEGQTTSDIALDNNANLENLFYLTKEMEATTFKIDQFDAYFEVTKITPPAVQTFRASKEAVNIPSNFTLLMTDNTHLRTFPAEAGIENGAILAFNDVDNSTVRGGWLHGDREERSYSAADNGLEGSHLIHVQSGRNVTIDSVNFIEGSKGGLTVYSKGFSTNPADYYPTKGVIIKNCLFKDIRRMGISLTDGSDIIVEGNTFINNGQPMPNSDGGEVGYAINVEPARRRDDNGVLLELQKAFDITIRNNTETNSRAGFVTVTIGQDITVEDNDIGTRVVYSLTNGTKILNNRFNAAGSATESWAIFAAGTGETVFNNEIAGNEIAGYTTGIVVSSNEAYVHDNSISDVAVGLQMSKPNDARVIDNDIVASEKGIAATNTFINNGEIRGNNITTTNGNGFHIFFSTLNNTDETRNYSVILEENKFFNSNKVTFANANGVTFRNNDVTGGIELGNATNVNITSNTKIDPSDSDGIRIYGTHTDVSISNNNILEPSGAERYNCINNNSDTPNGVNLSGNTCTTR